jgi:hypothetical protein
MSLPNGLAFALSVGAIFSYALTSSVASEAVVFSTPLQVPFKPDVSQCDNCKDFPEEWLEVRDEDRIDLQSLPPQRRLDFLIGEWEVLFPYKSPDGTTEYDRWMPVGFDVFSWRDPSQKIIDGIQEWPFTSGGRFPFRAHTDFRYFEDQDRWQMTWLTNSSAQFYTGGLEKDGVIALYQHKPVGDRKDIKMEKGMRYVLRNITSRTFLTEEWNSSDGGETYNIIKWRALYRRRTP